MMLFSGVLGVLTCVRRGGGFKITCEFELAFGVRGAQRLEKRSFIDAGLEAVASELLVKPGLWPLAATPNCPIVGPAARGRPC